MNASYLSGRLTKDPEIRYGQNQMAVCKFNIAVDRPTKRGEEKKADFLQITVFGKQAENCEKYLAKGSMVVVIAHVQTGSYTDKDGKTVYTTDFIADKVEFMDWREKKEEQPPVVQDAPEGVVFEDDEF